MISRTRTLALGLAGLGAAGGMAGLGTFATFTGTTSASQSLATGTVIIGLGTAGSADNRLTIGATGLVPGDTVQRRVKLTNTGSESLASIVLTTTAGSTNVLTSDATNGLQMKIERCALTWVEVGTGPYTYTCATRTDVVSSRAVIGSNLSMASMAALAAGATDDMVVTISLPSAAGNTFQNLSNSITYTFDATQRAATDK